ncbi:MAG: metal-dependent hydrolase [Candidatus Aenigmatarchaeota archaeon]
MPDWKVHLIFGLLLLSFWLTFNKIFPLLETDIQKTTLLILLVPFVSIFPDIDMKKSKSRKVFAFFVSTQIALLYFTLFPATWYYGLAYFFLSYFLITLLPTKHRGITHSFPFSLVFSFFLTFIFLPIFNFNPHNFFSFFFLVFSAYSLHLLLDNF